MPKSISPIKIPWHGGACPVPADTPVFYWQRGDSLAYGPVLAGKVRWLHQGNLGDIVEYCIQPVERAAERRHELLSPEPAKISWNGGECPVPENSMVLFWLRGESFAYGPAKAGEMRWTHQGNLGDLVQYCVQPETRAVKSAYQAPAAEPKRKAWDGGPCPVSANELVLFWLREYPNETYGPAKAGSMRWQHRRNGGDILAYAPLGQATA